MIFAYIVVVAKSSTGTNALIEILSLCEETLLALDPRPSTNHSSLTTDNSKTRAQKRIGRSLVLIRGGLADSGGGLTASGSSD
jgi:hypothetical protein